MAQYCDPVALRYAAAGRCPSGHWKDAVAPLLIAEARSRPLIFVNCGANKGYAVADFLQRFHAHGCARSKCPTLSEWNSNVTAIKSNTMLGCGFCNDCRAPLPATAYHVPVSVHAFEMLAGNSKLLSILFERFGIPGMLHTTALSHFVGRLHRPIFARTGQENAMISSSPGGGRSTATEPIATTTVSAFAAEHSLERVDWLLLDAEGWDGRIIEGASQLLKERRISILEFEFNPSAMASAMTGSSNHSADAIANSTAELFRLLGMLHDYHYECLWQGPGLAGAHTSLRPDLLVDHAGHLSSCSSITHVGNLVCSHSAPILKRLRRLDFAFASSSSQVV
jgi:FkbM family methyltransferase